MIDVKVEGMQDLTEALKRLPEDLRPAVLFAAVATAAEPMRARMEQLVTPGQIAPHIKDHIGISRATVVDGVRVHDQEAAVNIGPTKDYFYGYFLEFGTVKMSAKPFMRPAFDAEKDSAMTAVGANLWQIILRAVT